MWHPVLGHLLRQENEMLRGRLAPLLASVAESGGKINRKNKKIRIWNHSWRGLTPVNSFGSVTKHPLSQASLGCQDKQAGQSPGGLSDSYHKTHWIHLSRVQSGMVKEAMSLEVQAEWPPGSVHSWELWYMNKGYRRVFSCLCNITQLHSKKLGIILDSALSLDVHMQLLSKALCSVSLNHSLDPTACPHPQETTPGISRLLLLHLSHRACPGTILLCKVFFIQQPEPDF